MSAEIKIKAQTGPEDPGDLVGVMEAAAILGVIRTNIARWRRLEVMPKPVVFTPSGPTASASKQVQMLWLRSDIERFRDERAAEAKRKAAAAKAAA